MRRRRPRNGEFVAPRHARLADSIPGARLIVREVPDEDAADLRALALLGIRPDAVLDVVAVAPDDGPVTVRVGGVDGDVARAVAQRVAVDAVVDGDEAPARMSDPRRVCDG